MQLTEIRSTLDAWLWQLANGGATPPQEELARLRSAWHDQRPQIPQGYHPIIEDRLSLVDSYLYRAAL